MKMCSFPGCGRRMRRRMLCDSHSHQDDRGMKLAPIGAWCAPRPLVDHPDYPDVVLVPLYGGGHAIIDRKDSESVSAHNWRRKKPPRSRTAYAETHVRIDGRGTIVSLHRFLWEEWGMPDTPQIDHENGNGLDCRRLNLRAATQSQNQHNAQMRRDNSSGFKGVDWNQCAGTWRARVQVNGVSHMLGSFADKDAAAAAVTAARAKLHGEFARYA